MREYLTKLRTGETLWRRKPVSPYQLIIFIYLEASRFVPNRRVLAKDLKLFRLNSTRAVSYSESGVDGRILGLLPPRFPNSIDCIRR